MATIDDIFADDACVQIRGKLPEDAKVMEEWMSRDKENAEKVEAFVYLIMTLVGRSMEVHMFPKVTAAALRIIALATDASADETIKQAKELFPYMDVEEAWKNV